MAQADATVIIPRRNFLIRALGFTAMGATVALPIVTVADARERAKHHFKELKKAVQDLYPTSHLEARLKLPDTEIEYPPGMDGSPVLLIVGGPTGNWE